MSLFDKPIAEKRYLTFREVEMLYGIGRKTVARLVRERHLRRRMVGTAWRYSVEDLESIFSGPVTRPCRISPNNARARA